MTDKINEVAPDRSSGGVYELLLSHVQDEDVFYTTAYERTSCSDFRARQGEPQ